MPEPTTDPAAEVRASFLRLHRAGRHEVLQRLLPEGARDRTALQLYAPGLPRLGAVFGSAEVERQLRPEAALPPLRARLRGTDGGRLCYG